MNIAGNDQKSRLSSISQMEELFNEMINLNNKGTKVASRSLDSSQVSGNNCKKLELKALSSPAL